MRLYITPHAAMRALQRRVTIDMIRSCVRYGKRTIMYPSGVCECRAKVKQGGKAYVLLDKTRSIVITCYRTTRHSYRKS